MNYMKEITALDIIKYGVKYGVEIMGDDFIGYKFIGEDAEFWNGLLMQQDMEEVAEAMNSKTLNENTITYLDYDSNRWSE